MTAGSGKEGAGDADRRTVGDAFPNEDRRLREVVRGGFMGRASEDGVPGAEGTGDAFRSRWDVFELDRPLLVRSGGAGLFDVLLRGGRSIFDILPCCERENWPSLVFKA